MHNMRMNTWLSHQLEIILLVIFTGAALAQSHTTLPVPSPDQNPTLHVNTRLVLVDVIATDNKGTPVRDLKEGDFTVLDEGQEQVIKVFGFHQPDPNATTDPAPSFVSATKLPPGYFTNAPQYKTNGALNIILLDALNTTLLNQATVRDAMIQLLAKLPPNAPVAVYLLNSKLTLVQDFTSDPAVLLKAIAGAKRQGSGALDNAAG